MKFVFFIFVLCLMTIQSVFACTPLEMAQGKCLPEQLQRLASAASGKSAGGTALVFGGNVYSTSSLMTVRQAVSNRLELQCDTPEEECEDDEVLPKIPNEYSDFILSFNAFEVIASEAHKKAKNCECIKRNLERKNGRRNFEKDLKKEKEEINKKILEAYSRQFVNDYSAIMEDATFFLLTNKNAFSDQEKAKSIQCNDPEAYNKKIKEVCDKKGITDQSFITKRKNYFINALDGGKKSFEERLVEMGDEMQSLPMPGQRDGQTYHRNTYDRSRIGLAHTEQPAKVAEHIVRKLLTHPETLGYLARFEDMTTPGFGLLELLEVSRREGTLSKFGFDEALVGEYINNQDDVKDSFRYLVNTHPGFMNAMIDGEVLKRLQTSLMKDPEKNILTVLENEPSVLEQSLHDTCSALQYEFANAVCILDNDLISEAEPSDLDKLIHAARGDAKDHSSGDSYHEFLLCEERNKNKDRSFTELAPLFDNKLPYRRSDYLERLMVKDITKHQNSFSQSMLKANEEAFKKKMSEAADKGAEVARSVSPGGVAGANVYARAASEGKAFSFGKPMMTREEARTYLAESKKYDEKMDAIKYANGKVSPESKPVASTQEYSNTVSDTSYVTPAAVTSPVVKPRDELSSYLTKKYPTEEVKRTVDELPEQDVSQLNNIKNESTTMLTQTLKEETSRMEQLQSRIETLKKQMSDSQPVKAAPENKKGPVAKPTLSNLSEVFTAAQPVKDVQEVKTQTSSQFSSPAQNSGSAVISKSSGRNLAASTPSSVKAGSLVVTSPEPLSGEINQEIKKQIEALALDPKAIEELKTKGFVFRYTVLENNQLVQKEMVVEYSSLDEATKQMIELKSLENQKKNQVSKLAVLRMILKDK